jgi:hypothetical protein
VLRRLVAALALLAVGAGCEDINHGDISDEINILVKRNDQLVAPATERLAAYRRAAVPQIETAMHTAAPSGRLHLIAALDRIGDEVSVPVLRHVAVFDVTGDVRDAAESVLRRWAAGPPAPRAARANDALAEIARKRAAGLGPLMFGSNGVPGVPSTVGAPEPIGATPKP